MHGHSLRQMLDTFATLHQGDEGWTIAAVVTKEQSSYRQPGAIMLVSPYGKTYGLVSGGCLEADIALQAKKVQQSGLPRFLIYDSNEEGSIAAVADLGCNGRIGVLLQIVTPSYRKFLDLLNARLKNRQPCRLRYCYRSENAREMAQCTLLDQADRVLASAVPELAGEPGADTGQVTVDHPAPCSLWVIGGGADTRPLLVMASLLGWQTTIADHRVGYARPTDFPSALRILRSSAEDFSGTIDGDAVLLMSHNVSMDAAWLKKMAPENLPQYIGLLGPESRKAEVFALAAIEPGSALARSIHGPMGFDIGGDTPESIALSVMAQCHQVLLRVRR